MSVRNKNNIPFTADKKIKKCRSFLTNKTKNVTLSIIILISVNKMFYRRYLYIIMIVQTRLYRL